MFVENVRSKKHTSQAFHFAGQRKLYCIILTFLFCYVWEVTLELRARVWQLSAL
jgi:hypothetical protein